jgi:signal transduction histidine kinase
VLPWIVLTIGIPASIFLSAIVSDAVENAARQRFERQAGDAKSIIENRIQFYADILYGLKALIATQGPVGRLQFHNYVLSLDLPRRYPGFDVVNFMAYVPAKDKRRFEESVRHDTSLDLGGYPGFAIKPPGERSEYWVLVYIEPMDGFEFSFGLDVGANPGVADPRPLLALLHSARDTGNLTASGVPLRIKSRGKEYIGLAFRLPVYHSAMPVDTVEQRRKAFIGSVGAGFNVDNLMNGVLNEKTKWYMQFKLYDAGPAVKAADSGDPHAERLLFDSNQLGAALFSPTVPGDAKSVFTRVLPMEVGGRIWRIHLSARKDAIIDHIDALLPWIVLAGGLLPTLLLFGMTYSLESSRRRAVEIANVITKDLRKSTKQLTALSRRLVEIQETERRQFSRELHDRIGQNLMALSINLDILKTQLATGQTAELISRLDDSAALLESTSGAVENVMAELRPPMLDDYGLLAALQWYGNEFARRTGIEVMVHENARKERLPPATEIALFRIAQEALNNVAKHANANHVDVRLEHSSAEWVMSVTDNGIGFDANPGPDARHRAGLGMVTMRERTQAIGGWFETGMAPGGGARIAVRIRC